jgi:hypothetical protein
VLDEELVGMAPVTNKGWRSTGNLQFEALLRDVVLCRWFGSSPFTDMLRLMARVLGHTPRLPVRTRLVLVHK